MPQLKNIFPLNFAVTFIGFLDTHLLIPIIALYASSLGAGVGMTGLIIGLYSLANTPANIFFGGIIDRVGYKRPLVLGLLGDALAMFMYSLCRLPFHLALVRLFHGISGGLVGPATMSITARLTPKAQKGRMMALYGMSLGAATLVGYGLSGFIALRLGYEPIFYLGAVILVLGILMATVMPKDRVKAEADTARPLGYHLMEMRKLVKRKGLLSSYCTVFAQYFVFGSLVTLLPLYVRNLEMESFHVAMLLVVFVTMFVVLQLPSGQLSDRIGRRLPVLIGLCLIIVSLVVLPTLKTFPSLAISMAFLGIAYALLFPSISALLADHALPEELGRATGIFHALLTAGVALGAPIMGFVAQGIGIASGLALSSGAAFLALVIAWFDLRD